jgi:hypothetical protein
VGFAVVGVVCLAVLASLVSVASPDARRAVFYGISFWVVALPLAAIVCMVGAVFLNLSIPSWSQTLGLSLKSVFGTSELVIIGLMSPVLLTRFNIFASMAILGLLIERCYFMPKGADFSLAAVLLLASASTLVCLGDKLPWLEPSTFAPSVRSILRTILSVGAMVVVFVAIIRIHEFQRFAHTTAHLTPTLAVLFPILVSIFLLWLCHSLGLVPAHLLAVAILPAFLCAAFAMTSMHQLMVAPLAMSIALVLSSLDRRSLDRRRHATTGNHALRARRPN